MDNILFRGKKALEMIEQNPLFDTSIFYKTIESIEEKENGCFIKACMAVNVDPEVVEKQAKLIVKLQKALDDALNERFALVAPSFKQYAEIERENKELKAKIEEIRSIAFEGAYE